MWLDELHIILRNPTSLAKMAITRGLLLLLTYLFEEYGHFSESRIEDSINCAARWGHLDVIKGCIKTELKEVLHQLEMALSAVVTWILLFIWKIIALLAFSKVMTLAARQGIMNTIKFLNEERQVEANIDAMYEAANYGYLDIVKYLHESYSDVCSSDAVDAAAENGHVHIIEYLYENWSRALLHQRPGFDPVDGVSKYIEKAIKLEFWKYSSTFMKMVLIDAMYYSWTRQHKVGNLGIIKYFQELHIDDICSKMQWILQQRGYLDIVQYLHENRSEGCTQNAMKAAAENGHLNCEISS
ncbi:hypothetical protein THRCLA_22927 [Thraustotheca clavata]|uniref:Ankyrin repeat n=1 Tax=Thraustotheca clavata TaxID=74557 RepID=A0A1V9YN70_9STRA|nr:hypothetical protein THRCLA_22927 [Thraustotheca clavata]